MTITVVAEYHDAPAEGVNVVSRTLIDDLVASGLSVRIIDPSKVLQHLPRLIFNPSKMTVFTHGPGRRTVLASLILRLFSATRITWVATRPDLALLPNWLRGKRTAHAVICNRNRPDLKSAALDAKTVVQPIGIAPERIAASGAKLWEDRKTTGVPIAVHVGHLRQSRGLEHLAKIKKQLGDQVAIIVVASPYFEPESGVMEMLNDAGVVVEHGFISSIADVYLSADLYLFPAPPASEGAIEMPLSVIEAIACSLPVISTPFGALPEALADVSGVHFAEPQSFAETVVKAINELNTLRAPDGLPSHLNAHQISERVKELYEDFL